MTEVDLYFIEQKINERIAHVIAQAENEDVSTLKKEDINKISNTMIYYSINLTYETQTTS